MKLTVIQGSPKQGGNTDILLDAVIRAAAAKGVSVEKISLNLLNMRPCQACGGCDGTGECVIKDDMQAVYRALDGSDAVVVGSPVFFCSVTAQVKIMADRMQCRWVRKYALKRVSGKTGRKGAFICCGAFRSDEFFNCARRVVKAFMAVQDIELAGDVFFPGVDSAGDILKIDGALEKVRIMTERLISHYE
ncbi:MAG: flavodoxin family protein [Candidatus Omnitrophota bacterium]